ncbi:MAG: glycosyltransferase family 2 protein [Thermomicrobiales bacterium]
MDQTQRHGDRPTNPAELPLVTLITPTLNRAEYLESAIESVFAQEYPAIEYLVIDGGSTDGTQEILARYGDRLRWVSRPDRNQAEAVNRGFAMARGEFVGIVNSDDPLPSGATLPIVEALLAEPEIVAAYPDGYNIDDEGNRTSHYTVPDMSLPEMLCWYACPPTNGMLIRRAAIERSGGWGEAYRFVPDWDFFLRLALVGPLRRVPLTLGVFRDHPGSITFGERGEEMAREHIRVIEAFFALPDLPAEVRAVHARAIRTAYLHAGWALGNLGTYDDDRFLVIDRLMHVFESVDGIARETADFTDGLGLLRGFYRDAGKARQMFAGLRREMAETDTAIEELARVVAGHGKGCV